MALDHRSIAVAAFLALAGTAGASAQMTFENDGISAETSIGGTAKTGNTESTDVGLGVKLRHETDLWRNIFGASYDWGSAEGNDTKNRLAGSYELARLLNERLYSFGRASYEHDVFSGYDQRAVFGGGLGYDMINDDQRTWSLQGGPAYRVDDVEASLDPLGNLLAPAERQTSAALNLGSRFETQVNDLVTFRNDTDITSSVDTNTLFNTSALTAQLMGAVAARFSFDVSHDTDAPLGTEKTDTTTRAALVYSFGGE